MRLRELTPEEKKVIVEKGTELPFTGHLLMNKEAGTYTCKRCGAPLFPSDAKFESGSGWPSFDDALPGAVAQTPDPDGQRTEISCKRCGAHLGHVFKGEGFTPKSARFCVNSVSMDFVAAPLLKKAWFAGGCFWGVEYYFDQLDGVLGAVSGYMGGSLDNPNYQQVRTGRTGHAETVEVTYDASKVSYETLARLFFEIHDPTQVDGQGPDLGTQYRSEVFYTDPTERTILENLTSQLKAKGLKVATHLTDAKGKKFYPAEDYHQDYYDHKGQQPTCHFKVKRF